MRPRPVALTSAPAVFTADNARRWWRHFGRASHASLPYDIYSINLIGDRPTLSSTAVMAVGIYVVVDADDTLLYIGKVCRSDPSGIRSRFADHQAARPDWAAVWLLPLDDDCPDAYVLGLEAEMIGALRPRGNFHHVPPASRHARSGL